MKQTRTYRFLIFILIGLLSVAFSQSFAKVEKVEKVKTEQSNNKETEHEKQEHVLKTYEAVMSVYQLISTCDAGFVPSFYFPVVCKKATAIQEQLTISTLPYFEVLFETSICTNAP